MRRWAAVAVAHPALSATGALLAIGVLAFGVAASGVMPLKASSGHWAITEWLLHFAMRRSVSTHALVMAHPPRPDMRDPRLVTQGAGHFDTGCRPCHGAPGQSLPVVPQAMTPHPPSLADRVASWSDRELFYIVRHGVKFTGMPAWPRGERADEVWPVVAFLRELPTLDEEAYLALVQRRGGGVEDLAIPDAAGPPPVVVEACARCHGFDGLGRDGAFPTLAGQRLEYLTRALTAYADGRRYSGIMEPIATALPPGARATAARYYASIPRAQPALDEQSAGAATARSGVSARDIPACVSCHRLDAARVNDAYPRLDGLSHTYLAGQLRLFKTRRRGGSDYGHIMLSFADRLTDADIDELASYFSGSGGGGRRSAAMAR